MKTNRYQDNVCNNTLYVSDKQQTNNAGVAENYEENFEQSVARGVEGWR